ncbi:MAG: TetR/AcrR family transcriptional regulator [Pyrinomonadaceae bacterium]|nr:TetR/AcrR family transcriptional regulator [Pyrinomonadaceae bacterium]
MSSKKLQTRDRILEETRKLMISNRGTGVKMADIAKAAGISRQAIYLHFESRTELLVAAVHYQDELLKLADRVAKFRRAKDSVALLDSFIEFWGNYVPEIYGIAKALMVSRNTDAAAEVAWKDRMDSVRDGCKEVVDALNKERCLGIGWTKRRATEMLATIVSIESWERLTIERGWSTREYIKYTKRVANLAFVEADMD